MIEYLALKFALIMSKILPFPVIYKISDIFYLLLYHVFKYRKQVVFQNLKRAFPQLDEKEIKKIAKKYYKNLSDLLLETLKFYTLSPEKIKAHIVITNPAFLDKYFEKNQSIILAGAHLGNWELGALAAPLWLKHQVIILYKPIKNKFIDREIKKLRSKFGSKLISINITGRSFKQTSKPSAIVMLSDQNPPNPKKAIWVDFFNIPTATLHGLELYSKMYKLPVIYFEILKKSRGYYQATFYEITSNPTLEPKGAITAKYMQLLELSIKKQPDNWLWSHRRWKHTFKDSYLYIQNNTQINPNSTLDKA